jgi:hypothetical protein
MSATGTAAVNDQDVLNAMVELEGQTISLAELAGEDMTSVAESRFSALPDGIYLFEVLGDPAPHLEVIETGQGNDKKKKPAAVIEFQILDVLGLNHPSEVPEGPESLIGRKHRETFFISDLKGVGYLKAFVADIGQNNSGAMGGLPGKEGYLTRLPGVRFQAPIKHRENKNDADKVYVNISRDKKKILPLPSATVSGIADGAQVAATA